MPRSRPAAFIAAIAVAASLAAPAPSAFAQSPQGGFTDHTDIASVHQDGVDALAEEGVVEGCDDGTAYCPADDITREQMASFIGRALDLPRDTTEWFADVTPGSTHGGHVGALARAGITEGCDDEGNYCPRDPVSREQMASFLTRAYALVGEGVEMFDDVSGGAEHAPGIAGVAASLVTEGCTDREFCPRDDVTREQMASFVARAMGVLRDARGCPTTAAPTSGPGDGIHDHGTAAERFPVNTAEQIGNRLFVFTIDLDPSRIAVDDVNADGTLAAGDVVRNVEVPTGRRTWATEVVGSTLYFGQDFTPSSTDRDLYRLEQDASTPERLTTVPGTELWDMTSDADGRLYIGTSHGQTVYRYTPDTGTLDELRFGGPNTGGQVVQVEYDDQDDTLYLATGRFASASTSSGRLLAIDGADDWQPGADSAMTARELLPGGDPGLDDVDAIVPGVYSLEVTDELIAVGFETQDARLVVLERDEAATPGPGPTTDAGTGDDEPGEDEATDGEASAPEVGAAEVPDEPVDLNLDAAGEGAEIHEGGGSDLATADEGDDVTDDEVVAPAQAHATYTVRDNVQFDGEGKVESVRIDPDTGTVFAAGSTSGAVYTVSNGGSSPATTQQSELARPVPGAVNRDMFLAGDRLVGVASTGQVWSIDRATGSQDGANSPRELIDAGAQSGAQLPQSLAVGNGHVAVAVNNALVLHEAGGTGRHTLPAPGEAKTMTTVGDQLYGGMYSAGSVFRQPLARNASGSFEPGQIEGTWGGEYGRPRDIHHVSGEHRLLVGSRALSSSENALVDYTMTDTGPWPDPTITPDAVAPDQETYAVTSVDGRVILGGSGADAQVVSRPLDGGGQQWATTPVPGDGTIVSLETAGGGVHGLTREGSWFSLDAASGEVERTRKVLDDGENMVAHGGWLYAVDQDCLVAIDVQRGRAETLQDGLGSSTLGDHVVAVDPDSRAGTADAYVMRGDDLIRVRHQQR